MPERWIIGPVVSVVDGARTRVVPKVSLVTDPGRPAKQSTDENGDPISVQPVVVHVTSIYQANWCLSLVSARDFTNVNADGELIDFLEGVDVDISKTPRELGMDASRVSRIQQRATDKGVDASSWTMDTPIIDMVWDIVTFLSGKRPRLKRVQDFKVRNA